jgi:hypothetical protein
MLLDGGVCFWVAYDIRVSCVDLMGLKGRHGTQWVQAFWNTFEGNVWGSKRVISVGLAETIYWRFPQVHLIVHAAVWGKMRTGMEPAVVGYRRSYVRDPVVLRKLKSKGCTCFDLGSWRLIYFKHQHVTSGSANIEFRNPHMWVGREHVPRGIVKESVWAKDRYSLLFIPFLDTYCDCTDLKLWLFKVAILLTLDLVWLSWDVPVSSIFLL